MTTVLVPAERVRRWFENFERSHGAARYAVRDGALDAVALDGSVAQARLPFDTAYAGEPDPTVLAGHVAVPTVWGVLLVRKGGFAVARVEGPDVVRRKVGQRHVQGRTKAGGQSQQRFARRRDNQARAAYEAAADHAAQVLGSGLQALVTGGDRTAVDAVLDDPRLRAARQVRGSRWLALPDPRASVLDRAVADACAVELRVANG